LQHKLTAFVFVGRRAASAPPSRCIWRWQHGASSKNHYQTLGLSHNATVKEIREAFIQQSKLWHPDSNSASTDSHEQFVKINEAYSVLSKPDSRRTYDRQLGLGGFGGPSSDPAFSSHRHYDYHQGRQQSERDRFYRFYWEEAAAQARRSGEGPFPTQEEYERMANRVHRSYQRQHRQQTAKGGGDGDGESYSDWRRRMSAEDEIFAQQLREIRFRQYMRYRQARYARSNPMTTQQEAELRVRTVRFTVLFLGLLMLLSSANI
uniref:J domain-containing protein n=2 Tax=Macrostomum lignano TaxID=282301 RepID=A0A1I8H2M7_9PLAT